MCKALDDKLNKDQTKWKWLKWKTNIASLHFMVCFNIHHLVLILSHCFRQGRCITRISPRGGGGGGQASCTPWHQRLCWTSKPPYRHWVQGPSLGDFFVMQTAGQGTRSHIGVFSQHTSNVWAFFFVLFFCFLHESPVSIPLLYLC